MSNTTSSPMARPSPALAGQSGATIMAAILDRVSSDHDAIAESVERLRAEPGLAAQLLPGLTRMLTDHYHYLAERTPQRWTLGSGGHAVTFEDDRGEVVVLLEHLQGLDSSSPQFRQSFRNLIEAVGWHIDAEEATLFRVAS